MPSQTSQRAAIGAVAVGGLFVCVVLTWFGAVATALFTCGGDGGYAYAAPASRAGRWCEGAGDGFFATAQLLLPLLVFLACATYAVVKVRWSGVVAGVLVSATATAVMYQVPASFDTECTEEQVRDLTPEECAGD
ncbi:hypothetical protein [Nocardioides sp. 503]|uniref:hypothetical protein n=1 Tax=Nocardioides sp. 503 TaxID=2508326 RepID=UPI00106FA8D3|nr:hypothetical protein [Nocardioides sp. 503]